MSGRAWAYAKRCLPAPFRAYVKRRLPASFTARLRSVLRGPGGHVEPDRMALDRRALLMSHSRISGFDMVLVPGQPHRPDAALNSSFYDRQHEDDQYRQNNWLLDELAILKTIEPRTVVEIGCGNGRFLRAVAPYAASVVGLDWAQSPELRDLPANVRVLRLDVVTAPIPNGDLICSADVLEHFAPRDVEPVVAKLAAAGPYQHHVIACYDDGHTHLSILPPVGWLAIFRKHCSTAYLADIHYRRNDPAQIVCTISNLPSA